MRHILRSKTSAHLYQPRLFRISNVLSLGFAVLMGFFLFWASQSVQRVERDIHYVSGLIVQEQDSLRVLEAEWDYLNRPERLELLAQKYLPLAPTDQKRLVADFDPVLPQEEVITSSPLMQAVAIVPPSAPTKAVQPKPSVRSAPAASSIRNTESGDFQKLLHDLNTEEVR